jgi:hypothetical protein
MQHTVTVSPHGMKLVKLRELQTAGSEGGIRVTYTGGEDTLLINGGLEDQSAGYSASLPFSAPQPSQSESSKASAVTIAELGLMTGAADPMMLFPAGTTFTPYSVLRNVSEAAVSVTPTLWWMEAGRARSARLQTIRLLPYQAQSLDVKSLLSTSGLRDFNGNFNIVFDAEVKRGSLLLASGSVDQTNTYMFEVFALGIKESAGKSLPYWSVKNGDDTMITLWNPADEAQDLVFKLVFSGSHYGLQIHLEPRATRTFNVSEIIQNQVPDAVGNTIPATVREGSAKIVGAHADNENILVAMYSGVYNIRKATCGGQTCYTCDGWTESAIVANPFGVAVSGTNQLKWILTWNTGQQNDYSGVNTTNWNGSSNITVQKGLIHGVTAGSANVNASNNSVPVYTSHVCYNGGDPCPVGFGGGGSGGGTVLSITNVVPSSFLAGSSGAITIFGSGFNGFPGSPMSIKFSGTGISATGTASPDGTQITGTYQVAASAPIAPQYLWVQFTVSDGGNAQTNQWPVSVTLPTISGPNVVWWFNGKTVSGFATQITLTTQASGTWSVTAGANEIHLSSTTGQSVNLTGTGTLSHTANDVKITVTVNGVTSSPFSLSSQGPKFLSRSSKLDFACSGQNEQGWESQINYKLRDNFNNIMAGVPVNEAFSGSTTWPQLASTPGTTTGTGAFTDGIFVCAQPGGLNPMPLAPQQPPLNTLVDSFPQAWCAGAGVSNSWGSACQGAGVQNGTLKRYLDHGDVTVP